MPTQRAYRFDIPGELTSPNRQRKYHLAHYHYGTDTLDIAPSHVSVAVPKDLIPETRLHKTRRSPLQVVHNTFAPAPISYYNTYPSTIAQLDIFTPNIAQKPPRDNPHRTPCLIVSQPLYLPSSHHRSHACHTRIGIAPSPVFTLAIAVLSKPQIPPNVLKDTHPPSTSRSLH